MNTKYNGSLTREQFLFSEMRITARLLLEGISRDQVIDTVYHQNLFQYPTEKMLKNKADACLRRLACINDAPFFIQAIANGPLTEAKQAALVALMRQNRLMAEFMINVIGGKYRTMDKTFNRKDLNLFFMRLQQQDETVAGWTEGTVEKIKTVIMGCLKELGYIMNFRDGILQPVFVSPTFTQALINAGLGSFLPAFNDLD